MTKYDKIEKSLKDLPMTWYPALMMTLVKAAIKKSTWKKGKIHIFVKGLEKKYEKI